MKMLWKMSLVALSIVLFSCSARPPVEPSNEELEKREQASAEAVNTKALKHFMDGQMFMTQGNYPMAILEFQDALKYDPGAPSILTSLADAYLRIGKFDRAVEQLQRALVIDPKDRDARELLGEQYLMQNELDQAEEQYSLLAEFYPELNKYEYVLAEIMIRKGEAEGAQKKFWAIYQNNPSEFQALRRAAEVALNRRDYVFAFDAYALLTGADPDNAHFWRRYSELAIYLQKFSSAIDGLERLIELTNDDPSIREQLARVYLDSDNMRKADSLFTCLYEEGHRSSAVLYYLGRIAMQKEDYVALESYSAELTERYPDEPSGYTNLALAYINLEKTLDAISILLKAREKFPDSFAVHYLLGNSYDEQKNYLLAKKSLLSALEIDGNSRPAKHLLATVHNHLGEWESSVQLYEELLALDEDDGQALNNYSYTLAEKNVKLEQALQMAKRALEMEPDNPAYLDTIGWIYFKLGDLTKAEELIEKSIHIDRGNAVVLEHLGDVLMQSDRKEEAMGYYRRALELDSDNEELRLKIAQ